MDAPTLPEVAPMARIAIGPICISLELQPSLLALRLVYVRFNSSNVPMSIALNKSAL